MLLTKTFRLGFLRLQHFVRRNRYLYGTNAGYSRNVKDQFHQPDATPEEIRLVNERLKLRKALRAEYLRKATDPHSTEPILFDPLMQRYYSMHMTYTERFIPTFKNWCAYMGSIILPIVAYALYLDYTKTNYEKKLRMGMIEYKDRTFRYQ